MTYRFLSAVLHPIADRTKLFLTEEWGIPASKICVETEFDPDVPVPTLHAHDRDQYIISIEVSDRPYPPQLDAIVLDCRRLSLPVKLYVAMPEEKTIDRTSLQRAKDNGVGVLIVSSSACREFERALSLSLVGVRKRSSEFPKKLRHSMADAHTTFVQGDPAKACANVYDEIEILVRKICRKAAQKGWWKTNAPTAPDATNPAVSLKNIAAFLTHWFDRGLAGSPALDSYLLSQIEGIVGHRNQTGHKPRTLKALRKRDQELRTRFDHAVSTFLDLVTAAAPLRL
jgi:hypothetical protein